MIKLVVQIWELLYLIDEDIDGIVDCEIENTDFSFVQFRLNLVLRR
jgi:hypothetical protein